MDWKELVGYGGSVLVLVSLTLSSIMRLRLLNMLGGITFAVYGWLVGAWPVLLLNSLTAGVNLIYLLRMRRTSEVFELLEIPRADNRYLQRFLEYNREDIARFFPRFDPEALALCDIVFILRGMRPVGLVACRPERENVVIELDYVVKSDRDFRCADFFFHDRAPRYAATGRTTFLARADAPLHASYLHRMGFTPHPTRGPDWYSLPLRAS